MPSEKFLKFMEIWEKDFAIMKTIDEGICVDAQGQPIPWYTYPAIEYLSQFDYRDKKIFEYGCGYSLLFWAKRAQKVIGIEDNPTWYEKWKEKFHAENLQIRLKNESEYTSSVLAENEKFDVICIDGKQRLACVESALSALSADGLIILDDSDRVKTSTDYRQAIGLLKESGLLEVDFYGFCPMNIYPKATSLFLSRKFNFKTLNNFQPAVGIGSLWSHPRKQRKKLYKIQIE